MFLGFANFYQRFIVRYLEVAIGLTNFIRGLNSGKYIPFQIIKVALRSFILLKKRFTKALILYYFNLSLPIQVEINASSFIIAKVISQLFGTSLNKKQHFITFYSYKLSLVKKNYKIYNSKLLAIILAFKHQSYYLYFASLLIIVCTNYNNLKYFITITKLNKKQIYQLKYLAAFDFIIKHQLS